jgi:hypothetical protein
MRNGMTVQSVQPFKTIVWAYDFNSWKDWRGWSD